MANELGKDQVPLAGVVMCCTSIAPEARHLIATAAEEMGAIHKFDLTSDVTHLIIGDVDTPKYKYVAKERPDVKVVLPSFVDAVRQIWIEGGDVDLEQLETENKAPTLLGLKICSTGFEDARARENMKQMVVNNGAEFHGDLTKAVTHLIAAAPEGKKYEHSRRWQIKIVGYEWLQDSIERGMVLEEALYDPILASQDRGKNAYNKREVGNATIGKRQRDEEKPVESVARRKLRRTMSKKMESQQETIWADIASAGSGQAKQDECQPPETDSVLRVLAQKDDSMVDAPEPTAEPTRRPPAAPVVSDHLQPQSGAKSTFQGAVIYLHGFTAGKVAILQTYLGAHGARHYVSAAKMQAEVERLHDGYVVVPHDVPQHQLPPIPGPATSFTQVTEWWVESCIENKRLLDPETYPLCKPFEKLYVKGFEQLTICPTGFLNYDLLHVNRVVTLMGATYSEYLNTRVDILVCNSTSTTREKLDFAIENNIEAVDENWLYKSIEMGVKQPTKDHAMKTETPTVPIDYVPSKTKTGAPKPSLKGRMLPLEFVAPSLDRRKAPTRTTGHKPMDSKDRTRARRGPFFEDDEDESGPETAPQPSRQSREQSKRPASQPLCELSQEQQNSQLSQRSPPPGNGKNSMSLSHSENLDTSSAAVHLIDATTAVVADTSQITAVAATSQQKERLKSAIVSLLAQKESADARRSTSEPTAKHESLGKRRHGPLGRAASGGSFVSNHSIGSNVSQDERTPSAAPLPDPSQKIIYEDDRAQEERLALIKRLGGKAGVDEVERRRVESIGTVKDAVAAGVTSVAGGRGKRKVGKR